MSTPLNHKLRHRTLDRFRQKLWAVPALLWLRLFRRGGGKSARRRNQIVR